jgi:acetyltransferase-like isoleucine patch superfamily enzyme
MIFNKLIRYFYYYNTIRRLKSCGKHLILSPYGFVLRPHELSIGDRVFINRGFHISARNMRIGNDVMIGPDFIAECDDHIHNIVGSTMYDMRNERHIAGITIENDVWIGARVTVLKGVTIGEGCVVGAGSVVVKSLPPYSINLGIPCRPLKTRFTLEQLADHLLEVNSAQSLTDVENAWRTHGLIA